MFEGRAADLSFLFAFVSFFVFFLRRKNKNKRRLNKTDQFLKLAGLVAAEFIDRFAAKITMT